MAVGAKVFCAGYMSIVLIAYTYISALHVTTMSRQIEYGQINNQLTLFYTRTVKCRNFCTASHGGTWII